MTKRFEKHKRGPFWVRIWTFEKLGREKGIRLRQRHGGADDARLGVEGKGEPRLVRADHLAVTEREAVHPPFVVRVGVPGSEGVAGPGKAERPHRLWRRRRRPRGGDVSTLELYFFLVF
jgi:hypothetical protein